MALKPSSIFLLLLLYSQFVFSISGHQEIEDSLYSDAESVFSDSSGFSNRDMQYVYEQNVPSGVTLDEDQIKKLTDRLDYSEKVKPEDTAQKLKSPEIIKHKSEGGGFWTGQTGKIIVYLMAFSALIFLFVFLVFQMGKKKFKTNETDLAGIYSNEVINAESLMLLQTDRLLEQAMENGDLRTAVRILYLKNLRLLMEKNLLRPSPEKTNLDYIRELGSNPFQPEFIYTTGIFEKIWYGESIPDRGLFQTIRNRFSDFQDKIRLGK